MGGVSAVGAGGSGWGGGHCCGGAAREGGEGRDRCPRRRRFGGAVSLPVLLFVTVVNGCGGGKGGKTGAGRVGRGRDAPGMSRVTGLAPIGVEGSGTGGTMRRVGGGGTTLAREEVCWGLVGSLSLLSAAIKACLACFISVSARNGQDVFLLLCQPADLASGESTLSQICDAPEGATLQR
eukprot:3748098-Amphidinium_carterae.2